jgi:signal transduction histidine kinase
MEDQKRVSEFVHLKMFKLKQGEKIVGKTSIFDLSQADPEKRINSPKVLMKTDNTEKANQIFDIVTARFGQDESSGYMIQFIDVTSELKLEEQKRESRRLEMTNANVSHELRNPLNAIIAKNLERYLIYIEIRDFLSHGDPNKTSE